MKTVEMSWRDDKTPEAKKFRDKEARRLRREGYKVEIDKGVFSIFESKGGKIILKSFNLYRLSATKNQERS